MHGWPQKTSDQNKRGWTGGGATGRRATVLHLEYPEGGWKSHKHWTALEKQWLADDLRTRREGALFYTLEFGWDDRLYIGASPFGIFGKIARFSLASFLKIFINGGAADGFSVISVPCIGLHAWVCDFKFVS